MMSEQSSQIEPKVLKVFVAIPTLGSREDSQVYALRRIEKRYGDKIQFVYPNDSVRRIFHDYARNKLCDEFMESDCDIIWFLDADVIPPDDILDLVVLHGEKWKLAGGIYPVWMTPTGGADKEVVFTVYRKYPDTQKLATSIVVPMNGTDFVEGVATGCLFIKREILEKLEKPYFEFKYDNESRDITEGEDLGFCRKMGDLNEKFFVDFSLVCHHMKKISLLEINNYAINYAKKSLAAHERSLRQAIAKKKLMNKSKESNLILPK